MVMEDIATAMTAMAAGTTTAETAMAVEEVLVDTENKSKFTFIMREEGRLSKIIFHPVRVCVSIVQSF